MSTRRIPRSRLRLAATMLMAVPVLIVAAGCTSGSASSSAGSVAGGGESAGASAAAAVGRAQSGNASGTTAGTTTGTTTSAKDVLPVDRSVVVTGSLAVRVDDVSSAASRVSAIASGLDGYVANEQLGGTPPSPGPADPSAPSKDVASLSIRVPTTAASAAIDQISGLGTVLSRSLSTTDVTSQVVDVNSRLQTMRASVARVRALLAKATSIGDIVTIEGELTKREAELESWEAQQKRLADQTAMATLAVTLSPTPAVAAPEPAPASGFGAGLTAGWRAFIALLRAAATGLGAVLPFLLLAPLVVLAWWWRHRARAAGQ